MGPTIPILPKVISNSKSFRKNMRPSHFDYLCQIMSMKNNSLQKINPPCQSSLKVHVVLRRRSCPSTPSSFLLSNLSPYILQMNQNLAQGCIITWKMTLPLRLPFCLNFSKLSCPNRKKGTFLLWSMYQKAITKPGEGGTWWCDDTSHLDHTTPFGPTKKIQPPYTNPGQN